MVEESRARPPNSTKVFVGNISATCSADDLHGLFATFGRVLDCDKVKGEFEIQINILSVCAFSILLSKPLQLFDFLIPEKLKVAL